MKGVKIKDLRKTSNGIGILDVYLKDILPLFSERVLSSRWRCWDLDYIQMVDGMPYEIREKRIKMSGAELVKFSESVGQVIDGSFEAKSEGATKHPWLKIVFFDSSWAEVWSSKPWVIEKVREHFKDVTDIPNDI